MNPLEILSPILHPAPFISPGAFGKKYLPHHFSEPWGEHHLDLFDVIQACDNSSKRFVRVEPRDHGKSSIIIILATLWWLAYRVKYHVLLLGAAANQIGKHYMSLQAELDPDTGNEALMRDFPHLKPKKDFKNQFVAWNDHKMVMDGGQVVQCFGLDARLKGIKEGARRPDVIVLDDGQDESTITTHQLRSKFSFRFKKVITPLGSKNCDIIVEGNWLHRESLVSELLQHQSWDGKLYRAENLPHDPEDLFPIGNTKQDGTPLWKSREELERKRLEMGAHAYAVEYLNKEGADEERIYDSSKFQRFDLEDIAEDGQIDDSFFVYAWWDPADLKPKKEGDTDFASITVLATKSAKHPKLSKVHYFWVLDNFIKKATPEDQTIGALELLKRWPIKRLYFEDNGGFGTMLSYVRSEAKKQDIGLPLVRKTTSKNKFQKIFSASTIIYQRTFFIRGLSAIYLQQWDDFGTPGAHDDGPDSTVSAMEIFERGGKGGMG